MTFCYWEWGLPRLSQTLWDQWTSKPQVSLEFPNCFCIFREGSQFRFPWCFLEKTAIWRWEWVSSWVFWVKAVVRGVSRGSKVHLHLGWWESLPAGFEWVLGKTSSCNYLCLVLAQWSTHWLHFSTQISYPAIPYAFISVPQRSASPQRRKQRQDARWSLVSRTWWRKRHFWSRRYVPDLLLLWVKRWRSRRELLWTRRSHRWLRFCHFHPCAWWDGARGRSWVEWIRSLLMLLSLAYKIHLQSSSSSQSLHIS